MSEVDVRARAEQAVRAVLPPAAAVKRAGRADEADLIVNGSRFELEWIGEGRLAEARRLSGHRRTVPLVVAARVMSPGARDELSKAGIGWVDETGAAEIAIGPIVVSRSGSPIKPLVPTGWTRSVAAVAEAALCGIKATTNAMHDATGLSVGSCVNALKILTDLGLLRSTIGRGRGSGREVVDPDRLLDAYTSASPVLVDPIRLEVGVSWRDLADGLRAAIPAWTRRATSYAVTGPLASEFLAPHLTSVSRVDVYVSADTLPGLEMEARAIGLKPVEGGRLVLRPFPTVAVDRLAMDVGGLRVAPWPRVYLDLLSAGVRGEDAAEHLKETIVRDR